MKLAFVSVSPRKTAKSEAAGELAAEYLARAGRMMAVESAVYATEAQLLVACERRPGQAAALLVLFDARGEMLTSEEFAAGLGRMRDEGAQRVVFGIGPADGWSAAARGQAARVVSLGRMTMPHELARAVAAEQIYRALTILAGHPYHGGH